MTPKFHPHPPPTHLFSSSGDMEALQRESGYNWEHWDGLGGDGRGLGWNWRGWEGAGKDWDGTGRDWEGMGLGWNEEDWSWTGMDWDGVKWDWEGLGEDEIALGRTRIGLRGNWMGPGGTGMYWEETDGMKWDWNGLGDLWEAMVILRENWDALG